MAELGNALNHNHNHHHHNSSALFYPLLFASLTRRDASKT